VGASGAAIHRGPDTGVNDEEPGAKNLQAGVAAADRNHRAAVGTTIINRVRQV
jgi:hypothetical protein